MFPKISSGGSRFLEAVKPVDRPGANLNSGKAAKGDDGGYGPLGYSQNDAEQQSDGRKKAAEDVEEEDLEEGKVSALAFQPGLTQVILDFSDSRKKIISGEALHHYENEAKSKAERDPEAIVGSQLDKKAA